MRLLCIDPGTTVSGTVQLDTDDMSLSFIHGEINNVELIDQLPYASEIADHLAIEAMAGSYGTTVGADVIQTIIWTGRFMQAFDPLETTLIYRPDVKNTLADNMRANDAAIRQAIIDRYPPTGGGKRPQIGTKAKPGPLYGVSKHAWAALGVGLTWIAKNEDRGLYDDTRRLIHAIRQF